MSVNQAPHVVNISDASTEGPRQAAIIALNMAGNTIAAFSIDAGKKISDVKAMINEQVQLPSPNIRLMYGDEVLPSSAMLAYVGCDLSIPLTFVVVVQEEVEVQFAQVGMCRFPGWKAKSKGYMTYEEAEAALIDDDECMYMDIARVSNGKYDTFFFYHESGHCDLSSLPILEGPHNPDSGITFKKVYAAKLKGSGSEMKENDNLERVVFAQSGMCRFRGRDSKVVGYLTYDEAVAAFLADEQCIFMDLARPRPNNTYDAHLHFDTTGKYSVDYLPKLVGPHHPDTGTTFKKVRVAMSTEVSKETAVA